MVRGPAQFQLRNHSWGQVQRLGQSHQSSVPEEVLCSPGHSDYLWIEPVCGGDDGGGEAVVQETGETHAGSPALHALHH